MSKSEDGQYHSIGLLDDADVIRKKFARAVTDSQKDIRFDPDRPGVFNLLTIYRALSGDGQEAIERRFEGKGYGDLKREVADQVIAALEPLQARYRQIDEDPGFIEQVLRDSVEKLRPTASATMDQARRAMGLR